MDAPAPLQSQGNVHFRLDRRLPRWPQECVVCGKACVESWEVRCSAAQDRNKNFLNWNRSRRSFPVPVHMSEGDCLAKLKHPIPFGVLAAMFLLCAGAGLIACYFVVPKPAGWIFAFLFGGIVAGLLLALPVTDAYPDYASFLEVNSIDYTASFRRIPFAQKFAELNRDIVVPWQGIPGDVSINIVARHDD